MLNHSTTPRRKGRYGQATRTSFDQGVVVREVIPRIIDDLLTRFERQFDRFAEFRDRRHYYKGKAERGLVLVLVVGVLAALGALTAVALTIDDSGVSYLAPSTASSVSSTGPNKPRVVTVSVARQPAGKRNVVVRTVSRRATAVKGQTVREMLTLTTERTATVTDVQPVTVTAPPETVTAPSVTVTVIETVTCKKKC